MECNFTVDVISIRHEPLPPSLMPDLNFFKEAEKIALPPAPRRVRLQVYRLLRSASRFSYLPLCALPEFFGRDPSRVSSLLSLAVLYGGLAAIAAVVIALYLLTRRQRRVLRFGQASVGVIVEIPGPRGGREFKYSYRDLDGAWHHEALAQYCGRKRRAGWSALVDQPILVLFDPKDPTKHITEVGSMFAIQR